MQRGRDEKGCKWMLTDVRTSTRQPVLTSVNRRPYRKEPDTRRRRRPEKSAVVHVNREKCSGRRLTAPFMT